MASIHKKLANKPKKDKQKRGKDKKC
ncbi:Hypothetical protein CFV354_1548 [Campylobacter fetus subsp. venerealis NCTC 10354]|nr:Hypothetical protein CFV354_1548 [Campylobacter fetus subsp. venerealis NCTC 10354]